MAENDLIYLRIPTVYKCIYNKLLIDLSSLGIKSLNNTCKNSSMSCSTVSDIVGGCEILDSWNMFQIACAAFEIGELEKADKIIDFINSKMNYCCTPINRNYGKKIYFGMSNTSPQENTILEGRVFNPSSQDSYFNFNVSTKGHFIAVPENYTITSIENGSFRGDWLYNPDIDKDFYTRTNIYLEDFDYVLWYCEFAVPLNSRVEVRISY